MRERAKSSGWRIGLTAAAAILLTLSVTPIASAQLVVSQKWQDLRTGPFDKPEGRFATVTNGYGEIYVAGQIPLTSTTSLAAVWKFDQNGNIVWQRTYAGLQPGKHRGVSVAEYQNGGVYLAAAVQSANGMDIVVIAYDGAGSPLWNFPPYTYSNPGVIGDDEPVKIASGHNRVYITGNSDGVDGKDIVTIALNRVTGAAEWVERYDSHNHGNDTVADMAVNDPFNASGGGGTDPELDFGVYLVGSTVTQTGASTDIVTIKYDNDALAVPPLTATRYWTRILGDTGADDGVAIDYFAAGRVYITGRYHNPANGTADIVTMAYNSVGGQDAWVWDPAQRLYNGPASGKDFPVGILSFYGPDSNVVVGGTAGNVGTGGDFVKFELDYITGAMVPNSEVFYDRGTYPGSDDVAVCMAATRFDTALYMTGQTDNGFNGDSTTVRFTYPVDPIFPVVWFTHFNAGTIGVGYPDTPASVVLGLDLLENPTTTEPFVLMFGRSGGGRGLTTDRFSTVFYRQLPP